MAEDNTPTVNAKKRKPTKQQRLRVETVKKLRALGAKRKGENGKGKEEAAKGQEVTGKPLNTRAPKVKKSTLATPPLPKAKFRKRQVHKSWLPTHLFHAKRAHMTPPSAPLWRFALPVSPTQKSYRPTHRASSQRGAVCWDTSCMSTIGLEGQTRSLLALFRALGVAEAELTGAKGTRWRRGTRVLETCFYEREKPHHLIAPALLMWCVADPNGKKEEDEAKTKRTLFVRVHPSAFLEIWEEVLRLAKVAKPEVKVEDLRFEIGSIQVTGPGGLEALLGALWLSEHEMESVEETWSSLAGLIDAAMLPPGSSLGFSIQDPKLHFPPHTVELPKKADSQNTLLELLATWPIDSLQQPQLIFDRKSRLMGSKLPSQKAVSRRKALAPPGTYPVPLPTDPQIPVLVFTSNCSRTSDRSQPTPASFHILAPWKAIQPIWYSLMYYPLSTGQQPRFGGLDQQRQFAFEAGRPWFPGDFPGTKAGWDWEATQRKARFEEWKKRPKAKRVSWEKVQVGEGQEGMGEIGDGWACDWEFLLSPRDHTPSNAEGGAAAGDHLGEQSKDQTDDPMVSKNGNDLNKASTPCNDKQTSRKKDAASAENEPPSTNGVTGADPKPPHDKDPPPPAPAPKPDQLTHLPAPEALTLLKAANNSTRPTLTGQLISIRLTLLNRGHPQPCARIYRLPSPTTNQTLRKSWLALHPSNQRTRKQSKHTLPTLSRDVAPHVAQQRLAASLLEPPRAGDSAYPACPSAQDLVGFVTSGNFNLAEGKGSGVGCLMFEQVIDTARDGDEGRLCIVRNAGGEVGRLATWDIA